MRALRTAAHNAHERALVKAMAAGQNLVVADVAHAQLRAAGALVEEAAGDSDEGGEEELVLDEKVALASSQLGASTPTVVIGKTPGHVTSDASADADVLVGSWMSGRSSVTNASTGGIRIRNDGDTPR